jgi:hypothetical protein
MQRLIAEQLYWINITGYPTFQAHRRHVKNYSFDNQAYLFMEQVWLENEMDCHLLREMGEGSQASLSCGTRFMRRLR